MPLSVEQQLGEPSIGVHSSHPALAVELMGWAVLRPWQEPVQVFSESLAWWSVWCWLEKGVFCLGSRALGASDGPVVGQL